MPVLFCIVAANAKDQQEILTVASAVAKPNPRGRKVLSQGDAGFPSQEVKQAIAGSNVSNPGAVVLRNDCSVFDVLSVEDAKNGAIVEDDFSRAATGGL